MACWDFRREIDSPLRPYSKFLNTVYHAYPRVSFLKQEGDPLSVVDLLMSWKILYIKYI